MVRESWLSRAAALLRGRARPAEAAGAAGAAKAGRNGTPNDTASATARLVLDTNVFVAAAYNSDSASRRLLEAVEAGRATLLVSPPVFGEYREVLPKAVRSADAERRIRGWLARAEAVEADRGPRVVPDDPQDDKFVALARAGKADAIVSSDGHLLALAGRIDVPVLPPKDAERLVR